MKLIASRVPGNEAAAIAGLKTIHNAQLLHREMGQGQHTDLAGLLEGKLIDEVLASGSKQGYRFECRASTAHPASAWVATAVPLEPGKSGRRSFAINQEGDLYYSDEGPSEVDPASCAMPASAPAP